jgi:copper chaperone NosL
MNSLQFLAIVLILTLSGLACQPGGPEAIQFGQDQCAYCRMTIANPNYGAELITDKGRLLKYDAAECLVHHLADDAPPHRALFAIAYDTPRQLHPVESLRFLIAPEFKSPMGANLAAFTKDNPALAGYGEAGMDWKKLQQTLAR